MRCFVAIPLAAAAREHVAHAIDQIRRERIPVLPSGSFKWVRPENYHLTLKFLGEVRDEQLPAVIEACESVSLEWPPSAFVSGLALEPERGGVRLIVGELGGDVDAIKGIFVQLEDAISEVGFRREGRAFWPHVTIARGRTPVHLTAAQRQRWDAEMASRTMPGPAFAVDRIQLMQSELGREGPTYTTLATIPIGS